MSWNQPSTSSSRSDDWDKLPGLPEPMNINRRSKSPENLPSSSFNLPQPIPNVLPRSTPQKPKLHIPSLEMSEEDDTARTTDSRNAIAEVLFPAGKIAELQQRVEYWGITQYIGLEYIIEIQHNTIKKMPNNYACLLCDFHVKSKNNSSSPSTMDQIRAHMKSMGHKIKYLTKYFPRLKVEKLDAKKTDQIAVTNAVEKIVERYEFMMPRVKIVVGMKLFKRKMGEIKSMVENSSHIREDDVFLAEVFGIAATPKLDKYADAFAMLEKEAYATTSKTKTSSFNVESISSSKRNLDELALGALPLNPLLMTTDSTSELSPQKLQTSANPSMSSPSKPKASKDDLEVLEVKRPSSSKSKQRSLSRGRSRRRSYSSSSSSSRSSSRDRRKRSKSRSPDSRRSKRKRKRRPRSRSKSRSRSRSRRHRSKSPVDYRIKRFFDEEQLLLVRLNLDKKKYMAAPELHPDYNREWERFYNYKCAHFGPMHSSYLHDEWARVWKTYFFDLQDTTLKQERNKLMNRHKVYYSDLEKLRKKREQDAKREEERRLKLKQEREEFRKLELEKIRQEEAKQQLMQNVKQELQEGTRTTRSPPIQNQISEQSKVMDSEVSVLSTLRLLTVIESDLGDLGCKVDQYLMKVVGSSSDAKGEQMLKDRSFVEFFKSCRELLRLKVELGDQEQRKHVYKVCVDNISILVQRAAPTQKMNKEIEEAFKTNIASKIVTEYAKYGRQIYGRELEDLIQSEFERVKDKFQESPAVPEVPLVPIVPTVGPTPDIGSGIKAEILDQIDWNEIQNVINQSATASAHGPASSVPVPNVLGTSVPTPSVPAPSVPAPCDEPVASVKTEPESKPDEYDDLTIEELASLFKNFKKLERSIQESLIQYMKRLEKTNPAKVTELKKNINNKS